MTYPYIDKHGFLNNCKQIASPNFSDRPKNTQVSLLVVHFISLPPYIYGNNFVEQLFTNRINASDHPYFATINHLRVSSHFYIKRSGEIIQFVSTDKMAFHAGVSSLNGREKCNEFSIGIELEGSEIDVFETEQYKSLAYLCRIIKTRYPIQHVRGHEHIAPERKIDPGPYFDWYRMRFECGWSYREIPQSLENLISFNKT
ncbi:putative N-acetyl-anhydromuramyl-L-alanine amidase [Taylorella equigenitalis 14/56]|uniref:1,6-anhydro-N-acetylmuramyl-L-alanine amidase AmpD n=1 Tax=Taylorella equigenitalis 14/56 TaxID=1091497 RepID=I7IJD0_9BURK|nr:1,6-anhydro-N-acetylmuramyl-L-alanine amidase AmpD [Taylorella equigenitalis]ASY30076.1 N-acetylmuramoyl-L-alanine amidase [Taylorella equigenitalis]KOS58664.1 N-acetyl-anhydromuranmyl-L-alanine amidase [Taylorella equigenitalis]CCG18252.1 putative N-acetyl-anhydromuramyl-L-alanine amidase [Taylorella equigenitalis 14/56]